MTAYNFPDMPQQLLDEVVFTPMEEVAIAALRESLEPAATIGTLIPQSFPHDYFILARRYNGYGLFAGDHRVVDQGGLALHTFTRDPDGDEKGALLSEACRKVLMRAHREQRVYPGGHILSISMRQEPRRVTDWATSSGPVQFADLPADFWRYETIYDMHVRRPRGR